MDRHSVAQRGPLPTTTSEERVLAGIAHLALCGGIWLVAPLAIFLVKRRQSTFVAFHALQATMVAVAFVPLTFAAWALALTAVVVASLTVPSLDAGALVLGALIWASLAPVFFCASVSLTAAIHAFCGRVLFLPLVGGLSYRILEADLRQRHIDVASQTMPR